VTPEQFQNIATTAFAPVFRN